VKDQLGHASIQITVDTYGHLIPGENRTAMDRLDDLPTQSDATQAQPEAICDDAVERPKFFRLNGDPNFRQLEPDRQMAQACRCDTTSGLNEKLGTDAAIG
jgi:hypothetical protein